MKTRPGILLFVILATMSFASCGKKDEGAPADLLAIQASVKKATPQVSGSGSTAARLGNFDINRALADILNPMAASSVQSLFGSGVGTGTLNGGVDVAAMKLLDAYNGDKGYATCAGGTELTAHTPTFTPAGSYPLFFSFGTTVDCVRAGTGTETGTQYLYSKVADGLTYSATVMQTYLSNTVVYQAYVRKNSAGEPEITAVHLTSGGTGATTIMSTLLLINPITHRFVVKNATGQSGSIPLNGTITGIGVGGLDTAGAYVSGNFFARLSWGAYSGEYSQMCLSNAASPAQVADTACTAQSDVIAAFMTSATTPGTYDGWATDQIPAFLGMTAADITNLDAFKSYLTTAAALTASDISFASTDFPTTIGK
ncbi:hypothetical protein WDW86_07855 [Bdellovibrionota bacterium FG-2]